MQYSAFLPRARQSCPAALLHDRLAALSRLALDWCGQGWSGRDWGWQPGAGLTAALAAARLADFTLDPRYRTGRAALQARLGRRGLGRTAAAARIGSIEARLAGMERMLAHGDLSSDNLTADGQLIDPDMWGLYPPFYDIALVMAAGQVPDGFDRAQDYLDHVAATLLAPRHRADALALLFLTVVLRLGIAPGGGAGSGGGAKNEVESDAPGGIRPGFLADLLDLAAR